jgi:protein-S-isoprenylcysteine O-methyltransferase Ste14
VNSRLALSLRAALYASGFVLLWSWIAVAVEPLDARLGIVVPRWLRWAGLAVAVPGAVLGLWCVGLFVSAGRGTPAPFDPPREFVATGPYRFVRNPMYVGGLSVILGAGLWLGSPSIVVLGAVFALWAHLFVVFYEERTLERRFGESYRRYKRRVRRWSPGRGSPD